MMTTTRICLAADFRFDRLGRSWERAFCANGVGVVRFDTREAHGLLRPIARNRYGHRLTIRSYNIRRWASRRFNEVLCKTVLDSAAGALVIHNGAFVFPETLEHLKSRGVRVVIFHADNPFPPHYNNRPETLPVARVADLYLTWSERLVKKLNESGVRNSHFLPFGWDSEVFPFAEQASEPWPGVLFVGGWDRGREDFLNQIAERFPLRVYGPGYWGSRTRPKSRARTCWMGRELQGPDAAKMIRESSICLNLLRNQHVVDGHPDGLIMRHFEVPGAGGFLLSTRSGGATRLFPEGVAGEYFATIEECVAKIEHYLAQPLQRKEIASRARDLIIRKHCYIHRAREVLTLLHEMS